MESLRWEILRAAPFLEDAVFLACAARYSTEAAETLIPPDQR